MVKTKLRKLFTHILDTERIGVRDDGSEYERIAVYMKCDVDDLVEEQKKEFNKMKKDIISRLKFSKMSQILVKESFNFYEKVLFGGE